MQYVVVHLLYSMSWFVARFIFIVDHHCLNCLFIVILFYFQSFASLTMGEYQLIRQTLLNFFQDMHIRVSI
jgi:hypothetical protein